MPVTEMTRLNSRSLVAPAAASARAGEMSELEVSRLERWRRNAEAAQQAELESRDAALRHIDVEDHRMFRHRSA